MSCGKTDQRGRIVRQIPYDCKVPCGDSYFTIVHYSNPTLIS